MKNKKINPTYLKQIEQLKIDAEEYEDEEMKPVYKLQKTKLEELQSFVGKIFIAYAIDGLIKAGKKQVNSVTNDIKTTLTLMGKELGQYEVDKVTDILSNSYTDSYYKNAFILDEGFKVNLKFDLLKQEFIDAAVNQKFKNELFSDRIWTNKADMIDKLQSSIVNAMQGKTTIDKVARDIKNTFNVTAYQSQRLVRTENARIQTQASIDIAKNTGVKQVMWSATLDNLTNEEDASLDGKVWNIDEAYPMPPLHPFCRCCLCNIPFADWSPSKRLDNESKQIIDYVKYEDWKNNNNISY